MIKPKALKLGDTIGIIAPASSVNEGEVEKSIKALMGLGFKVKVGESCYSKWGYLAGRDDVRARDINAMFGDEEVDGIICIRGGYGATKILNQVDTKLIKKNPKVFVGYSDITSLHILLNNECNLVTFHGPMVASNFIRENDDFSVKNLLKITMNKECIGEILNPDEEEIDFLTPGKAKGKIVGGNLALIAATIGTKFEIDTRNNILFLEDIDEKPYRIDRMLTQLRDSGKLKQCEGIILGDFNNCDDTGYDSLCLDEVFEEILIGLNKPIMKNLKSGHCHPMVTIPFGLNGIIDSESKSFKIIESAVS